jgi:hypothetical protein
VAVDKTRWALPFNQILLILMGVLLLYLVVDFGRQVGVSYQRREELRQLDQKILAAEQESFELDRQWQYINSPDAAEAWARANGWTRQDEVLVVFVGPSPESAEEELGGEQAGTDFHTPRDAWWDLFFGTR